MSGVNSPVFVNARVEEAFKKKDLDALYNFEDLYLKLSKDLKKEGEAEGNELKLVSSRQMLANSDECARLADIVSGMAHAILKNNRSKNESNG